MVAPKSFGWSFQDVCVYSRDRVFLVAADNEAAKKDLPISWICRWLGDHWDSQSVPIVGTGVAVAYFPQPNALIMGVDGTVIRWGQGPVSQEQVDASDSGPQNYGDLREIRTINKKAYVVGMSRTVYCCEAVGKWKRLDHGVRLEEEDADGGFNSIHGFNDKDIYAVGWGGEIWKFDGKQWKQSASPTNVGLQRVVCAPNGIVYCCGQQGMALFGSANQWKVFNNDVTSDTFWGMTFFKGRLYLSTSDGLFVAEEDRIEKHTIKPQKGAKSIRTTPGDCFYRLDSSADVMWSIGEKMAIFTGDGEWWQETPYE